ncbi:MAG TPA: hypothetical protein VKM72_06175 [Thermoanaerobaculia bacterium]|nr:hypothetical protein [Thermoanaerobaculia bacterium]
MPVQAARRWSAGSAAAIARHPASWGAVIALGVLVRVLAAFPPFRSPLQSDATMTGLTAFEILRGDLQVFLFNGTRLGALESYLHVPVFALFGASRGTLFVAPQIAGAALLVAFAVLAREILGPEQGLAALLFLAVPSPVVLLWNVQPIGYAETLLCIAVTLACAARIVRCGPAPLPVFGLGLAAGLGWWGSALSLAGTLPAALWIFHHRAALPRRGRSLLLAAAGFLLGALPWIAINVRYPLISFGGGFSAQQGNFQFRPVDGLDELIHNVSRFGQNLAGLLLRADGPRPEVLFPVVVLAGALYGAALLLAALRSVSRDRSVSPIVLPLLVVGCTGAFFVLSAAGSIKGQTERYVLPIGLAAPLLLAPLGGRIVRRSPAASALACLVLLTANVSGYCLPGTAERAERQRLARAEDRLLDLLVEKRIAWVFGTYWDVYSLNFLSGETIWAIPDIPAVDYHGYGRSLGCAPAPFAVISSDPTWGVEAWARRADLRGTTTSIDGAFEVFVPTPNPPPLWAPEVVVLFRGFRQGKAPCGAPPPASQSPYFSSRE